MLLIAPEARGPVSTCSKNVRILGHIAGATVKVLVNGTETFSRVSNWPDDFFEIGTTLAVGDKITAIQEFNGDKSPESPLPIIVQEMPSSLAHLTVQTHLYQCGTAVWADGSVPGADVRVLINNNEAGKTNSVDGIARIQYTPGLSNGESMILEQKTCNGLSKQTTSPPAEPWPNKLPTPLIYQPLIECQTAIKIGNILGGATVTIYRDGVKSNTGPYDLDTLTWIGLEPLKEGETIEIEQSFTCKREAKKPSIVSDRAKAEVLPASELGAPVILTPVCPKPTLITISSLVPSARVILYDNGTPIAMTDTPETTFSFYAPPLNENSKLTARMQLCGVDGPFSNEVSVKSDKDLKYLSVSKVYECASHIFIRNDVELKKGKIVYALSKNLGMISAYHQVFTSRFLLPVAPSLVKGDEITVVVIGCGGKEQKFGPYTVENYGKRLTPPEIYEPVVENSSMVEVISLATGALINVYVDNAFKGQAISRGDQSYTPVLLPEPLKLGQKIKATHSLCSIISKPSNDATVVIPPPQAPQLIEPSNHKTNVPRQNTTFKWQDLGVGTSAAALNYSLKLYKGNNNISTDVISSTSHQLNMSLDYDTTYTWKVQADNTSGSATSPTWDFTTEAEPEPEPPENAVLIFTTSLYASYDGYTVLWPAPANEAFYICIGVGNAGNATSDPFEVNFALSQNGQSQVGTVSVPAAAPGWSDVAYYPVNPLPEGQYLFEADIVVNGNQVAYTSWGAWVGF